MASSGSDMWLQPAATERDAPADPAPHPERRVASNGCSYEFHEFEQWYYGPMAWIIWQSCATPTDSSYLSYMAADGQHWTYNDFLAWYGTQTDRMWHLAAYGAAVRQAQSRDAASAADEVATEHAVVPCRPPPGLEDTGPHDHGNATEHPSNAASAASQSAGTASDHPHILLHPRDVPGLKAVETSRVPRRSLQQLARDALNAITAAGPQTDEIHLEGKFPWQAYLACHAQASRIIGSGITRATAEFILGTTDANRGGQERMDFVVYTSDGTWCRLHPGATTRTDAKLILSTDATEHGDNTNTPAQSTWTAPPHMPFTCASAVAVPQQDRIGKRDAFRVLQNMPCGADINSNWHWWLFASNVGSLTRELIGPGIVEAELLDKWHTGVELLFRRADATEARLRLIETRSGTYQTQLV